MKLSRIVVVSIWGLSVLALGACCPRGQHRDVTGNARVTVGPNGRPNGGEASIAIGACHAGATGACETTGNGDAVAGGEVIKVPANYNSTWKSPVRLLTEFNRLIDSGSDLSINGGACGPVCVDQSSPACLQCRQDVAVPSMTPFLNYCLGSAFGVPPDRICASLVADTDAGRFQSGPITGFKRAGTVRYSDCGSPNQSDFDFDQGPTQAFASYIEDRGAHRVYSSSWVQTTGCGFGAEENESLVQLTDAAKELILAGKGEELVGPASQVSHSVWLFQYGGGDTYLGPGEPDGAVLISTALDGKQLLDLANGADVVLSGRTNVQYKPCNSDSDCSRWWPLRCLSDPQWGMVCKDPSAP